MIHVIFRNADRFVMQFYDGPVLSIQRPRNGSCIINFALSGLCSTLNECSTTWEPNEIQIHRRDKG